MKGSFKDKVRDFFRDIRVGYRANPASALKRAAIFELTTIVAYDLPVVDAIVRHWNTNPFYIAISACAATLGVGVKLFPLADLKDRGARIHNNNRYKYNVLSQG